MSKILVTGADGLVGSAMKKIANLYPHFEFSFVGRKEGDLTKEECVKNIYEKFKPDYVIHTAARVGGIGANLAKPAELFYENILMNSYMIHYGYLARVKKLIAFSSVCSFPDPVEMLEESLQQDGKPFRGNFAYGYAKRMVDIQIQAYRIQHQTNFCSVIPANMYGPNDNFSLQDGHVIPSLIHKCYLARTTKTPLVMWGDGSSMREFIFSEDISHLTLKILESNTDYDGIIVSNNKEISIRTLVDSICHLMKFDGDIVWDTTKPNGQFRRPSNTDRLRSIVPDFNFTTIENGLLNTIDWFETNYPEGIRK